MASYASVISLKHTIHRFLNSSHYAIVLPETETCLNSAYKELESLQVALQSLDNRSGSSRSSERVSALDRQIQDAVHKFEDELEFHISNHFLPQSESRGDGGENHPLLSSINEAINSFAEEVRNPTLPQRAAAAAAADHDDFGGEKSKLIGLSVDYAELKHYIIDDEALSYKVVSLVRMGGIGKTTLAMKGFEDLSNHFECWAWVKVGQEYKLEEIVQRILDDLPPLVDSNKKNVGLHSRLMYKRYLIVLDDVWDARLWKELANLFPKFRNGSRVLITTRLQKGSNDFSRQTMAAEIQMRLMDNEESRCLFCDKVFGEELCPPQLEKVGKKIVEKCDGLPLTIVTIASLLSKADKTVEYWNKAAQIGSSVFVEAYEQIAKVLIPSYHYLPQHLKAYFLYMGVFTQNYEIPISKLINLWSAEGFFREANIKYHSVRYLKDLVSNNVLMSQHRYDDSIKTCSLHSAFWQLCIRVARKNKFMYVLNSYDDDLPESIKGQRRLCIHNNILFGLKEAYNSMASVSAAHSLLCTGQYHQFPVPLCLGLRLLRVLDALTIRFYEFPFEVLNLIHLRYLALTYNGKIPASISKLWNLLVLIIRQHSSIRSPARSSYLPLEIWDMKELKHLQIMGSDLPDPNGAVILSNLKTLLDMSPRSCTKKVVASMPKLEKLGIRIELGHDGAELLSCFDCLSDLCRLESLKCVIVNPMPEVVAPPHALLPMLPTHLKKLSLSGFGYAWENMSKISASAPFLKVLKLRCYAFRVPEWITPEKKFMKLEYLLIEDTDLVHWRCGYKCFPSLKRLIIRHCYKLKEIGQLSRYSELQMIEVVDSNPSVVNWAKQERDEIKDRTERYNNLGDNCGNLDSILKVKEMGSD